MSVGKIIFQYFKSHKIRAVWILIFILLVTILALLPAQILRIIIDDVIENKKISQLVFAALLYACVYVILGIVTFLKEILLLSTSQSIAMDLRLNMMKHVHSMSYKALVNTDSGTLEAYLNNDVNAINELFTSGVIQIITDVFKMVGIAVTIFIYSVNFGYIVLGLLPVFVLFTSFVRKKMLKAQLKSKTLEGNVNKNLLETVENIEQLKVNKAEAYASHNYQEVLNCHFKVNQASNFYDAFFSPMMQFLRCFVVCAVLLVSGFNTDIFGLSVGMIVSAITLLTDLFSPIENLGMEIQTIQKSIAAIKRINLFFKQEKMEAKEYHAITDYTIFFDHVSFSYEEKSVIQDFSLKIKWGEKIVLQGPSGIGKSTLLKLAMGLLKPSQGKLTIGGEDSYKIDDKMRRELFSVVYQDPFFSGGTIYQEVSLFDEEISREQTRLALNQVGLDYITDLDEVLNDKEYSSGELALFNIARVIVRNPKIIFLDEMNAKIDPLTSKHIISLINQFAEHKTVISIHHYGDALKDARLIQLGN